MYKNHLTEKNSDISIKKKLPKSDKKNREAQSLERRLLL